MEKVIASDESIQAFKLLWGNYPAPVMLLYKSHTIVGVNKMAEALGITTGVRCFTLTGSNKVCQGCKASLALHKGEGQRSVKFSEVLGKMMDSFWVPLPDGSGLYVHGGDDITDYSKPEYLEADIV